MRLDALAKASITKFNIYPNAGGQPVSFLGGVVELSYYEDIMSPTIRVSMSVVDAGRAVGANDGTKGKISASDAIKLTGMEKCELEIVDALKQKIILNDIHISSRERISEKTKDVEFLEIVSKEYLRNESVRVVKRYDGKISDSVQKILREVLQTTKTLDIEVTQNERSFIGTTKKPFWFITWLGTQSVPQTKGSPGKTAGYFFYETHNGFKYKSIDNLMSQTYPTTMVLSGANSTLKIKYKSYIYTNTTSSKIPVGYTGKIIDYNFNDTSDMKDKLTMGTFNSSVNLFNSFESSFNCNLLNIKTQESGVTYAGTEYGKNLNSVFISEPSRFFTSNVAIGGYTPIDKSKEYDMKKEEILSTSASRYNQLFTVTVNITIPADFSLEAGELIFVDFPEQSSKPNPEYNERMGGVYMISALCHRITTGKSDWQAITSLELVRDSYGRKTNTSASFEVNPQTSSSIFPLNVNGNLSAINDNDIVEALNIDLSSQNLVTETEYQNIEISENAFNMDKSSLDIFPIEE